VTWNPSVQVLTFFLSHLVRPHLRSRREITRAVAARREAERAVAANGEELFWRSRVEDDEHRWGIGLGEEQSRNERLAELGIRIGKLVQAKNLAYGNSAGNAGAIMRVLYPDGVKPHQYDDALLVVRVLDKLSRIAQRGEDGQDKGGESPWSDISGYGVLGLAADVEAGRVKE
jgi:hypothetical protein